MGLVEFFLLIIVTCVLAFATDKIVAWLAPERPAIITKIIWGVAVFIIVATLIVALGLMKYDPKIPSLR